MSKPFHVLTVCSQLVVGLMAGAGPVSAQSSPVVFQGLPHRAVGDATLRLDASRSALDVSNLGIAGEDGVAMTAEGATSWTARVVAAVSGGLPLRLTWSALADGRPIGSAVMQQTGANFEMSAAFTGATTRPTYAAQVYNNGQLVGAIGGVPTTVHVSFPISVCLWIPEFCQITAEFHTLADGACMVKAVTPGTGPFRLPNGAFVTGNELRLVEEVRPAGHYPYMTFDTMVTRSDATSLTILSESVR
jgi:hypothetical protein